MSLEAKSEKARVLVVEDDPSSQLLMRALLDKIGFECIGVLAKGELAVAFAARERPEIVLMDINLEGEIDGIEAAEQIKNLYAPAIIFVTAQETIDFKRVYPLEPHGYIQKPIHFEQFRLTIELALKRLRAAPRPATTRGAEVFNKEFLQFLESMNIGELNLDQAGRVVGVNAKGLAFLGLREAELLGKTIDATPLGLKGPDGAPLPLDEHPAFEVMRTGEPRYDIAFEIPHPKEGQTSLSLASYLPMSADETSNDWAVTVLLKEAESLDGPVLPLLQDQVIMEIKAAYESTQHSYDKAAAILKEINRQYFTKPEYVQFFSAAKEVVGGDIFLISKGIEEHVRYLFMGDCTGHGLHSALGLIPAINSFYAMSEQDKPLAHIVRVLNNRIHQMLPTEVFVCAVLLKLDVGRGLVEVWNAGAPDILIANAHGLKQRIASEGLPLGVVRSVEYEVRIATSTVVEGDRIYLQTDGVAEVADAQGVFIGQERLEVLLVAEGASGSRIESVQAALEEFRQGEPLHDDMTFVEICVPHSPLWDRCRLPSLKPVWRMRFELDASVFRTTDFRPLILDTILRAHSDLTSRKEELFLVLSELYSNALAHGVLGIASDFRADLEAYFHLYQERIAHAEGWINISVTLYLECGDRRLEIVVEDSGPGFDFATYLQGELDFTSSSGRGIILVRSVCKELRYEAPGNKVMAVYSLEDQS